jgi:hypothetical protein
MRTLGRVGFVIGYKADDLGGSAHVLQVRFRSASGRPAGRKAKTHPSYALERILPEF